MYLLYLDESGHAYDPSTDFFVLAGFSIFERQTHWLEGQIDPVAERFSATNPREIEFHGSPMRSGKDEWKGVPPADRVQAVVDILSLLSDRQLKLKVYACVIEKKLLKPEDILATTFEEVACCFDDYLKSLYYKKDPQRGLVILDKSNYEQTIQTLSHVFKHVGHASGKLRNFAEVPLFLDSKASRLIQMADLIAYWIFRHFESGDSRGFNMISPYFARFGTRTAPMYGLKQHVTAETTERLAALAPHAHPFPGPTPKPALAAVGSATPLVAAATKPEDALDPAAGRRAPR
ncbi:DUF3800 domain-containing protein [Chenggangzhangella methanolivorans]|uniref:DUF3800 domain-containing protein n=1 Tax=Chenggangzhangella methanolivorans TaxID=1437009 RepID=A0A9E6RCJ5_9HYPH|nr:DUF3800 domain-containing protein [Chenggangzhangella methanolivorans]QZO01767.1 DUF3800 domain-containing protein [Chenggangzhangella methanolivorans]